MTPEGLLCLVYRNPLASSGSGITARANQAVLVGVRGFKHRASDRVPALKLRDHGGRLIAVPFEYPDDEWPPEFGGTFIWTRDRGFPTPAPIPVHDRRRK